MEFTTFLRELDAALADLPPEETARIREFYSELYFDAVENGKSEEEAVAALGDIGEIRDKTLAELAQSEDAAGGSDSRQPHALSPAFQPEQGTAFPPAYPAPPKKSHAGKILFWCLFPFILLVGVPLAAAAAVIYLAAWVVLASLWVVTGSCGFAAVWGLASSFYILTSSIPVGLFQLGTAVLAGGLGILFGVASLVLCRLFARASAAMFRGIRSLAGRRHSVLPSPAVPDTH